MANDLLLGVVVLWGVGAALALAGAPRASRLALALGAAAGVAAALAGLPGGTTPVRLPTRMAGAPVDFRLAPAALWMLGFGLVPAAFACVLGPPEGGGRGWAFGAACGLLGALGVLGLQDGASLLIAWEVMSLGGAVLLLGDRGAAAPAGAPVLFMLALLEVGAVALLLGVLLLAAGSGDLSFAALARVAGAQPAWVVAASGLLLLVGFGAKLGLLPFYDWFPEAYGVGSGASGVLLSGVVLNAAFVALGRGLLEWLPAAGTPSFVLGIVVTMTGMLSAILAILYAFQQNDWRRLLSLSSAENASISVAMLGAAMIFRGEGESALAGLAWTVALLHLAGHSLTKGALFLAADGIFRARASYGIQHANIARASGWPLSLGAVLAAMSLSAMPPQIGFVTEWYAFQTVFQGFRLHDLAGRLTLALTGAGLALTAAIALSTFVKVVGIGVFGGGEPADRPVRRGAAAATFLLAGAGLVTAATLPAWLPKLASGTTAALAPSGVPSMQDGLLLVPLTAKFAFISPSLLVLVMPLLALVPVTLVLLARRGPARRTEVWYGGSRRTGRRVATTSLTFSNALRTFYGFLYRPTATLSQTGGDKRGYFIQSLHFDQSVRSPFVTFLFEPAKRLVLHAGDIVRRLQSGNLNVYLGLLAALLVVILVAALLS